MEVVYFLVAHHGTKKLYPQQRTSQTNHLMETSKYMLLKHLRSTRRFIYALRRSPVSMYFFLVLFKVSHIPLHKIKKKKKCSQQKNVSQEASYIFRYGSPSMSDIEAFSRAYREKLDEAVTEGRIPPNASFEVLIIHFLFSCE